MNPALADVPSGAQETSHALPGASTNEEDQSFSTSTKPLAESLSGEALRDYQAALLLYQSGDFSGAAFRFRSAFASSGDVRLLWNEAASEQAARHYARAILLVERYLAAHSSLVTPEAESKARAFLEAATPLTARLFVEVNVTGASVTLDDQPLGATPLAPGARVDFGTHRLLVQKPHFIDKSVPITVTSAADVHVKLTLAPVAHQGRLVVRAGHGDRIAVNGRFAGIGSFDGVLPSGTHTLRVDAEGARPYQTRITIADDRTRALDVTLEPLPSGIPTWLWVAGGSLLLAGAGTASYLLLRPSDSAATTPTTLARVQLPLR